MNESKKRFLAIAVLLLSLLLLCSSCGKSKAHDKVASDADVIRLGVPSNGLGRETESEEVIEIQKKGITICIDPGHGFVDGGCGEEFGIVEKDITLAISNLLGEYLEELGYETIFTHDGETFPLSSVDDGNQIFNPNERVAYANTLDTDYFVSIHVNSYVQDTSVSGIRIYYVQNDKKTDSNSEPIAHDIAEALKREMTLTVAPQVEKQEKNSYAVVRETKTAASLIEVGFATNKTDAENMVNEEWQKQFAKAVADGINDFFSEQSIATGA